MGLRNLKTSGIYLLGLAGTVGLITIVSMAKMANAGEPIRFSRPSEDLGLTTPQEEQEKKRSQKPKGYFGDKGTPSPGPAISVPTPSGQSSGASSRQILEKLRQRRENWLFFMGEEEGSSDSPESVFQNEAQRWIGMGRASDEDMQYYFEGSGFDQGARGKTNRTASAREDDDRGGFGSDSDQVSGNRESMTWNRFFNQRRQGESGFGQSASGQGFGSQPSDPWLPLDDSGAATSTLPPPRSSFGGIGLSNGRLNSGDEADSRFQGMLGNNRGGSSMFQHEDPIASMLGSETQAGSSLFGQSGSQSGSGSGSQALSSSSSSSSASIGSPLRTSPQPSSTGGINGGLLGQSSQSSGSPNIGSSPGRSLNSRRSPQGSSFSAPTVLDVPRRGGF